MSAETYTVTSGGVSETATVGMTVTPVADIVHDTMAAAQNSRAHNLDLLANDSFENPGYLMRPEGCGRNCEATNDSAIVVFMSG